MDLLLLRHYYQLINVFDSHNNYSLYHILSRSSSYHVHGMLHCRRRRRRTVLSSVFCLWSLYLLLLLLLIIISQLRSNATSFVSRLSKGPQLQEYENISAQLVDMTTTLQNWFLKSNLSILSLSPPYHITQHNTFSKNIRHLITALCPVHQPPFNNFLGNQSPCQAKNIKIFERPSKKSDSHSFIQFHT